jgi:hypothetical protein
LGLGNRVIYFIFNNSSASLISRFFQQSANIGHFLYYMPLAFGKLSGSTFIFDVPPGLGFFFDFHEGTNGVNLSMSLPKAVVGAVARSGPSGRSTALGLPGGRGRKNLCHQPLRSLGFICRRWNLSPLGRAEVAPAPLVSDFTPAPVSIV